MLPRNLGTICAALMTALAITSTSWANDEVIETDNGAADQELREIVRTLQDQVERQQDQLDEQATRLAEAEARALEVGDADETSSGSSVAEFFQATQIRSWINVNYAWNSRGNGNAHIIGQNSNTAFHEDNHTFQVDQLWFQLDKAVSSESRAGFHADIAFGETARNAQLDFGGNDSVTVYSAYASFLAPGGFGEGIRIDAGELWTLIGAETVPAPDNLNITRGLVWNQQPVSHTGVMIRTALPTEIGDFSFALGAVNAALSDSATDSDRNKAITGQIAYASDKWDAAISAIHGSRIGRLEDSDDPVEGGDPDDGPFFAVNNDKEKSDLTMADFVLNFDPIEELTGYLNFTYVWVHPDGDPNVNTYAWAAAARYALTETLGAASRFEMLVIDPSNDKATDEFSLTFTFDKAITDHLVARIEGRFDWGINGKYRKAGSDYDDDSVANHQKLFLAEVVYSF